TVTVGPWLLQDSSRYVTHNRFGKTFEFKRKSQRFKNIAMHFFSFGKYGRNLCKKFVP
ncbi:Hypothetical protein FKW44_006591, partial [Caligus rogercresseyi]